MSSARKLIVVSNRGPVCFARAADGNRTARRGGGGLVTALRGLVTNHDVTWIASAMSDEDRVVAAEGDGGAIDETSRHGAPYRLRLVDHDPVAYSGYYDVVSNSHFWFVQHYLWGLATAPNTGRELRAGWTDGYGPVNRGFANAVIDELERDPEAAVFFHDYHLYLAPQLVRERCPDALLTHFIHIPWPEPDYWSALPLDIRLAAHEGLLANDLVGFHTDRWRRAFMRGCADIVGAECDFEANIVHWNGRDVRVVTHPISIDPAEFDELRVSEAVLAEEQAIVESRPEFLVVRVDRTDPSKNIVRGFRAFGLFLERQPEFRGRVVMLALLDPSRQGLPEYAEYLAAIEREARSVNERFAADGWRPVDLQIADNFPQAVAAYKQYDVLMVNSIFDGMNLVAKEGPLVNERSGVVILSENAGVHAELGEWALTVNPFDLEVQADALHEALTMSATERRRRAEAIAGFVREHDVEAWIEAQLADLDLLALGSPS
ncbi:MAG TPA: trehalose-6-phosphate synthase [Gaiellaceae bacterium]|nr:trehalose-6-phosphate synthase [Gaiellaceae bacterium]